MRYLIKTVGLSMALVFMTSCLDGTSTNTTIKTQKNGTDPKLTTSNTIDIDKIKERLCEEFPKSLVLGYHPDANRVEIEPIDNGSGGILHCDVKLFYGDKYYEYWKGVVAAWVNQQADPFWQYNPERNAALFHNVEGFGEKAVYINNMYEFQILKEGVVYSIVPPNNGSTTNSGIENKAIAIEIAKHYNL